MKVHRPEDDEVDYDQVPRTYEKWLLSGGKHLIERAEREAVYVYFVVACRPDSDHAVDVMRGDFADAKLGTKLDHLKPGDGANFRTHLPIGEAVWLVCAGESGGSCKLVLSVAWVNPTPVADPPSD